MKKLISIIALSVIGLPAYAGSYTANAYGKVTWVKIYNSDAIYFGFSNMPSNEMHKCSDGGFFAINSSIDSELKKRYFSMLLAAKTSDADVEVGYDNTAPNCTNGRPLVEALQVQ